ncbi:hypothetical protein [Pyrobaculum sp.]|uniref:hypothetical protein n=1 Tax=Pyrobaculum sp. TaxID=2004705 RepID=UPI003D0990F7
MGSNPTPRTFLLFKIRRRVGVVVRHGGSVAWKKGHVGGVFMYKANLRSFRDLP